MISVHLFYFVALSLTLGDYFAHLATRWEQEGRAGKQLQSGKDRESCPPAVKQILVPNVDSDHTAVTVRIWGGQERKG